MTVERSYNLGDIYDLGEVIIWLRRGFMTMESSVSDHSTRVGIDSICHSVRW